MLSLKKEDKEKKKNTVDVEASASDKEDIKRQEKAAASVNKRGRPTKTKTSSTRKKTGVKPPRTRVRSGNKARKIHEYISDEEEEEEEENKVSASLDEQESKQKHEMQDAIVEDSEPLVKDVNVNDDDDDVMDKKSDKLEVMVGPDPLQAMLLDMIPSLEPKTIESPIMDPPIPKREEIHHNLDSNPGPSKKKKVSYKDMVMDLLKD